MHRLTFAFYVFAAAFIGCGDYQHPPDDGATDDDTEIAAGVCGQFLARLKATGHPEGCGEHFVCTVYPDRGEPFDGAPYCGSDPANPRQPGTGGACGVPGKYVDVCYCQGTWQRHALKCLPDRTIELCPCEIGPEPDYGCSNNQQIAVDCAEAGWAEFVAAGCPDCRSFSFETGTCQQFNLAADTPCPGGVCDGAGNCIPAAHL